MNFYGELIPVGKNACELIAHPSGEGFLIRNVLIGKNLSVNSNGELSLKDNTGEDEKWQKGDKCMWNVNNFQGNTQFFSLEWY